MKCIKWLGGGFMKKDKKRLSGKAVLSIVGAALLISYFIYQSTFISRNPYTTQIVTKTHEYEYYSANAYIVRDESYISNNYEGTAVTMVKNGERVTKGDTVCLIFKDADAAKDYTAIGTLEKEIERYEQLMGQSNIQSFDISSINSDIKKRCERFQFEIDSGDLKNLSERVDALRDSITTLQIATGSEVAFRHKLNALRSELTKIKSSAVSYKAVEANAPGYFTSYTDGFENAVSISDVNSFSPELLENVLKAKPAVVANSVKGKLIKGFKWYILCAVENKYFGELKIGDTVYVNMPHQSINRLPTKVHSFGDKGEDKTVLVLECSVMKEGLSEIRSVDLQVIIREHTGYKVNREAIRVIENNQGVFIKTGNIIKFRKINAIYSTNDYVISVTPDDNSSGYIRLYDEVILKGEDLYDGKIIK